MKDTVVRQREADAWELRLAGVSQVEIARRLNLTAGGVSKLLARLYARVDDDLRRGAAAHRAVLFARLEALYGESRREWLASCAAGRANFKLAQTAIRALAEESKLLGLAAPVRLALDVNDDEQPEPPAVDLSRLDETK